MGKWVKVFNDNTREEGSDKDIELGRASWTRGKLDNISLVSITDNYKNTGAISIPNTEWYQFDRYEVFVTRGTQIPTRVARVIQAKITKHHLNFYMNFIDRNNLTYINISEQETPYPILEKHIGKWITLIVEKNKTITCLVDDKGVLNGDKQILR